ncbi:MAG: penicillin-binding protein activator [Myxococcota bacterium]
MRRLCELLPIALIAIVSSTTACGPKRVEIDGQRMSFEQGSAYLYKMGRAAEEKGDHAGAKQRFRDLVTDFEGAPEVPDALAELAQIAMSEGGCATATYDLDRLVSRYPEHPRAQKAKKTLERCTADAEAKKNSELGKAEAKFEEAGSPADKRAAALKAADAAEAGHDYGAAARWLLKAYAIDGADKAAIEARVVALIDSKIALKDVRVLMEETSGDGFPKKELTYKLARTQYHVRDLASAKVTLEEFLAKWPTSPLAEEAKRMLELIRTRGIVNAKTVGVLVPSSGKLKAYGEAVLQAVRLAAGEADKKGATEINIVVRDSKGDATEAAKAVQDFVTVDGAVAIVGALFRVEAVGAAMKAQELGVPLLTLTAEEGITDFGPYILRAGLTNAAQMDALVTYSMDVMGMKSFAILYPRHPYGEELLHLFWDRVEAKKGEIRGVQSYAAEETTFTDSVKSLVGRDVMELRSDYHLALKECQNQPDSFRRARCQRNVVQDLKPIIDFDALFIPDYPRTLLLIAPALAAEDIIVEKDPRKLKTIEKTLGRKVQPVTLLGANGWNSAQLPEKAGRYVENALFTDGFFVGDDKKENAQFVAEMKKQYSRAPSLPDALFYDAIRMVRQVIVKDAPPSREAMRQGLRNLHDFMGVTGKMSFRDSGEVRREVHILTIKDGAIQDAPPPSEKAPTVEASPEPRKP